MTINFNQIPSTVGVPGTYVEFDGTGARTGQAGKPYVTYAYGQMLAPKTAAFPQGSTAQPDIPVLVTSATQAVQLFGAGSALALMWIDLIATNSINASYAIPQYDDPASVGRVVTANYSTVYTAPAAISGVEHAYIGDRAYATAVAIGDTATVVAAHMAAAITLDPSCPFIAAASNGTLTLTAKNKGELANDVQIVAQYVTGDASPSGAFVAFTQAVVGQQNPTVSPGIASGSTLYMTHVVLPYNDATNYALMLAEAQDRWGAMPGATSIGNGEDDFMIFSAYRGSEAQFDAFIAQRNSEYYTCLHIEPPQVINGVQYAGLPTTAWQFAAAYAAQSAQTASVVCNLPLQNIVLNCIKPAPAVCRFPWNVRNRVILGGGSTYKYNTSDQVMLETAVTSRTLTDTGVPTDAERRVETQLAKSYMRWSVRVMLETTYPAYRLASDGTPDLPNGVATPKLIRGSLISLAKNVWVPAGVVERLDAFCNSLIVERSTTDCNTISFQMFPKIVNILAIKAGKISYIVC